MTTKAKCLGRASRDRVVGPYFIVGNLGRVKYLQLLMKQIVPATQEIASDDFEEVLFQQAGAPPHFRLIVRDY